MIDLLPKLREKGSQKGYYFNEKELKLERARENLELKEFINKNKECQIQIKELKKNNNNLRKLKEDLTINVSNEDKTRINSRIQEIIENSSESQSNIKRILEENYANFIKSLDSNRNLLEQERRISRNLHGSTVKNFQDVMLEFQSLESELKSTNENMILRSAELALGKNLSPEEKVNIIQNPEIAQKMVQEKLSGKAHIQLQNAVKDLEDRHAEIRKLEQSIMQVHKLIEELAGLVKLQGEIIDNICDNIATSKADAFSAQEDIFKSKENMIKARKLRCIIIIIVTIVLGVVLYFIFG
jgi:t-SNARE complex subunit (syntaxin)